MSSSESPAAAERAARAITDLVGDACLVLLADRESQVLRPAALAHRDRERRDALTRVVVGERTLAGDWTGHAFAKNIAFRLRHSSAAAVVSPTHGVDLNVTAAVVTPLRIEGSPVGVAVAFRDSLDFAYSPADELRVEQLAAGEGAVAGLMPDDAAASQLDPGRVLEQAPQAVWATDPRGRTIYVNHAACELVGVPAGLLMGEPLEGFLDPEPAGRDQILMCPDGREMWVAVARDAVSDAQGCHRGWVYSLAEVSARRSTEVAMRQRASAFEAVADFAEVALAGEDFGVLADEAVALTCDTLGADFAALAEIAPGRAKYVPRALRGWPRDLAGQSLALPERSPAALCLDEEGPVVVRDLATLGHIEDDPVAMRMRARSCLCVAIGSGLGVLSAHSKMPGAFSGQDLSFLGLLTATLATRWEPFANGVGAPALVSLR